MKATTEQIITEAGLFFDEKEEVFKDKQAKEIYLMAFMTGFNTSQILQQRGITYIKTKDVVE